MTFEDRKSRTDAAIKQAFLQILSRKRLVEMSISEVAREAHVSRSTIYSRYGNLSNLYVKLMKDMLREAMPKDAASSPEQREDVAYDTAVRFCEMLRNSSEYAPLVKEERFLPTLLEDSGNARGLIRELMDKGLDFQQAYTVAIFQMGGVFAVGTMAGCKDNDWPKSRAVMEDLVRHTIDDAVSDAAML